MGYTTSPLRYPGGKTRLANFIKLVYNRNDLCGGHYVEPYAGGAGIAWSLLFHDVVAHVHINDLSKPVYAFWGSVFRDTQNLCRLIQDTPVTMENWFHQKSIQENPVQHTNLELGFSTFFLNRTNRSGIIRGGVIGGKNQEGKWTLSARYNKSALIERIERIARYKSSVTLYNQDAAAFIIKVLPEIPFRSLVYLDPPYYTKGPGLYENYYKHEDHVSIAKLATKRIKQRWIVSYDNMPEVRKLYKGLRKLIYKLSYSAADRYRGAEVMFFSDKLKVPTVEDPTRAIQFKN